MTDKQNTGTILIVDDKFENLLLLSEMLKSIGYKLCAANNGQEAIDSVNAELPDLILLDINMPLMSGYEVCASLKANEKTKNVPIIFLSALNATEDKLRAFAAGGIDYITKPFIEEEVYVRVQSHLEISNLRKQLERKNDELGTKNDQLQLEINEHEVSLTKLSESYSKLEKSKIVTLNLMEDLKTENELRRKNEDALRKSEQKYRKVFETSGDAMFLVNTDLLQIADANVMACKMFGYTIDELLYSDYSKLSHEPELAKQDLIDDLTHVNQRWYEKNDSTIFPVEIFANHYLMDDKKIAVLNIRDISERVASEIIIKNYATELEQKVAEQTEQISTINKRLELAMSAGHIAWWDWDYKSGMVISSDSKTEMLGYAVGEIDNNVYSWTNLIHPEDYQVAMDKMKTTLTTDESIYDVEYRLRTKENNWKWFHDSGKVVERATDGEPIRIVGIVYDISINKKIEKNILQTLQEQTELSNLKSEFISIASHQFRTPLTTILSSIEILNMLLDAVTNDKRKQFEKHHNRIIDEVNHLTTLMTDVLTLSKIESGKITTFFEHTDFVEFCESIITSSFEKTQDDRTVVFSAEGKPRDIFIDKKLMMHILINLLSNAFKYSAKKPNPQLKLNFNTQSISIQIIDYGIGIPPDAQNNIFNSFFRAKNAHDFEGTGLGLAITKKFVELHRGTIEFKSELNIGTTFQITIPY